MWLHRVGATFAQAQKTHLCLSQGREEEKYVYILVQFVKTPMCYFAGAYSQLCGKTDI